MPFVIIDGPTIAAGESLSDGADLAGGNIARITVPQEYTPALLTFQGSTDGNFYNDVYDSAGREIQLPARPDRAIVIDVNRWRSIRFIKFRSGTRRHPVRQNVECRFAIAVETVETSP